MEDDDGSAFGQLGACDVFLFKLERFVSRRFSTRDTTGLLSGFLRVFRVVQLLLMSGGVCTRHWSLLVRLLAGSFKFSRLPTQGGMVKRWSDETARLARRESGEACEYDDRKQTKSLR